MKIFIYIFTALFFVTFFTYCASARETEVTYFSLGQKTIIHAKNESQFMDIVGRIADGTNDMLRFIVTKDAISEVRNRQQAIEIIFSEIKQIKIFDKLISIDRILMSPCNAVGCSEEAVEFYIGRGNYFTPPYINTKDGKYFYKLKEIINNDSSKKII